MMLILLYKNKKLANFSLRGEVLYGKNSFVGNKRIKEVI